jgi:hypothetical protein
MNIPTSFADPLGSAPGGLPAGLPQFIYGYLVETLELLTALGVPTTSLIAVLALSAFLDAAENYHTEAKTNAIRHCLLACRLTRILGPFTAFLVLGNHEINDFIRFPNNLPDSKADICNNNVGMDLALSGKDCTKGCDCALKQSRLFKDNCVKLDP